MTLTGVILLILLLVGATAKVYEMLVLHKVTAILQKDYTLLNYKKLKEIYSETIDDQLKFNISRILLANKIGKIILLLIVLVMLIKWIKIMV